MNNQQHINILFTKSYSLCLIFVLVGCIPAAIPPTTSIDTPANALTKTTSPSHSFYIPIERKEQTDWSSPLTNYPIQLQYDSLMLRLYEFPANPKIEQRIVTINDLSNGQSLIANPDSLTNQWQNPDSGPSSLPNSGGGGGGGRRRIQQSKL